MGATVGAEDRPIVNSAFVEYRARFVEPALERWHQGIVMQSLLRSLTPWGASLESISFGQTSAKASDVRTSVDLSPIATVVTASMGEVLLVRNNPLWKQKDETVAVAHAAVGAMVAALGVRIGQQEVTLGLHVTVPGRTPRELIGRFVNHDAPLVAGVGVRSYGVSVYREDGYWLLDTSRVFPDALFVRLGRVADAQASLEALAEALHRDEMALAKALGLGGGTDGSDPSA